MSELITYPKWNAKLDEKTFSLPGLYVKRQGECILYLHGLASPKEDFADAF